MPTRQGDLWFRYFFSGDHCTSDRVHRARTKPAEPPVAQIGHWRRSPACVVILNAYTIVKTRLEHIWPSARMPQPSSHLVKIPARLILGAPSSILPDLVFGTGQGHYKNIGGNTMAKGKDVTRTQDRHLRGCRRRDLAQAGRRGAAESGGPAARDFQQRQLLEHRHRREGRHSNLQCRRRANAGLHGRRSDEQDHARPIFPIRRS